MLNASKRIKWVACLLFFFTTLVGCKSNFSGIENGWWKHGGGSYLGDYMVFGDTHSHTLRGDTIFRADESIGIIKSYWTNRLVVQSLETNKVGYYVRKK